MQVEMSSMLSIVITFHTSRVRALLVSIICLLAVQVTRPKRDNIKQRREEMGKCKEPNGKPTSRQTFAVYCMTGRDIRKVEMSRQQCSDIIGALKNGDSATLPNGEVLMPKSSNGSSKSKVPSTTDWAAEVMVRACAAGQKAMEDLIASKSVAPMIVQQHESMFDDSSPVRQQWVVEGGPCGFADCRVTCSNSPSRKFIAQLKKAGRAGDINSFKEWSKSSYGSGYRYSFSLVGGQSLAYKEAYAKAFTKVLKAEGIKASWSSQLD
jgi:hypothetical protein